MMKPTKSSFSKNEPKLKSFTVTPVEEKLNILKLDPNSKEFKSTIDQVTAKLLSLKQSKLKDSLVNKIESITQKPLLDIQQQIIKNDAIQTLRSQQQEENINKVRIDIEKSYSAKIQDLEERIDRLTIENLETIESERHKRLELIKKLNEKLSTKIKALSTEISDTQNKNFKVIQGFKSQMESMDCQVQQLDGYVDQSR